MTALLLVILACFIVVAIKGLLDWQHVGGARARARPADSGRRAGRGQRPASRNGFTQIMAIAGQGLAPAVFLSYGYLAAQRRLHRGRHPRTFWKTVHEPRRHLGPVLGGRHRRRRHRPARRLHRRRPVVPRREPLLAGREHSGGRPGARAGAARRARLPGAAPVLARPLRGGVHDAHLGGADDDLLLPRHRAERDWRFTDDNRLFKTVFAVWIAVPALVAPFWQLPALMKAIPAMVGNLLMAPIAVGVILYFVNRPAMGAYPRQRAPQRSCWASRCSSRSALVANGLRDGCDDGAGPRRRRRAPSKRWAWWPSCACTTRGQATRWRSALVAGGVTAIEITMTVPGAVELIADLLAAAAGRRHRSAPAPCSTPRPRARSSTPARAFVVSPVFRPDVIAACRGRRTRR